MSIFEILAILLTLAAVFGWLNQRFLRMPPTIGLMLMSLLGSLALIGIGTVSEGFAGQARAMVDRLDFESTLMEGMLGALLFAGALHVNLGDLAKQKWAIASFATAGVLVSTALVSAGLYFLLGALGLEVPLIYCLLFGALISPTDPIAVLGILRAVRAPKTLETKITGESLFNDGIGVVLFLALLGFATGGQDTSAAGIAKLFFVEAAGGIALGLLMGWISFLMLKHVENYQVEVLVTLALVSGGYALAMALHTSGPLAMVVAGLMIGNYGRVFAMSDATRERLDAFWELIDEILNAVLFVLIGMEVLVLELRWEFLLAGLLAIPLVLGARLIAVGLPVALLRFRRGFTPHAVTIMTWAGLRGGISVALALSLPPGPARDELLTITYVVVVFSIVVQGLTIGPLLRRLVKEGEN